MKQGGAGRQREKGEEARSLAVRIGHQKGNFISCRYARNPNPTLSSSSCESTQDEITHAQACESQSTNQLGASIDTEL